MKELNIRIERINEGWTQEYVGNQIGVTKTSIHDLETGRLKPSYEVLCKAEKLFNKSHDYLFAVSNHDTPINQENSTTKRK